MKLYIFVIICCMGKVCAKKHENGDNTLTMSEIQKMQRINGYDKTLSK